jgi:hypothetical protein
MRSNSRFAVLALASLALAGCNPFHRDPVTEVTRDANANARWSAALTTPASLAGAVQMKGTATMQPSGNGTDTDFHLALDNATPGGRHPWQVHRGRCGQDDGVFGSPASYTTIKIGDDGRGSQNASVQEPTPVAGDYFVTVSASDANAGTIVACGNLAPPTR